MQSISTIGLDIAKSVFQVHGVDAAGQSNPTPAAGWLIDRLKDLPGRAKPTAVVAVSAGYVLLMGFVFMQAMNGVPLVRM